MKCPKCKCEDVMRHPKADTPNSIAYACLACGKIFYFFDNVGLPGMK